MLEAKTSCKRDFTISSYKAEVSVSYSKTKLTKDGALLIVLSDGSRWKVKSKLSTAELQQRIEGVWEKGDDIRIDDADDECPAKFLLKNARSNHVYASYYQQDRQKRLRPRHDGWQAVGNRLARLLYLLQMEGRRQSADQQEPPRKLRRLRLDQPARWRNRLVKHRDLVVIPPIGARPAGADLSYLPS
jgi:hypothetical protein